MVKVKRETDKALLVRFQYAIGNGNVFGYDIWLPKSQIVIDDEKRQVRLPKWLYKKIHYNLCSTVEQGVMILGIVSDHGNYDVVAVN